MYMPMNQMYLVFNNPKTEKQSVCDDSSQRYEKGKSRPVPRNETYKKCSSLDKYES
jgi:hypothetical protein